MRYAYRELPAPRTAHEPPMPFKPHQACHSQARRPPLTPSASPNHHFPTPCTLDIHIYLSSDLSLTRVHRITDMPHVQYQSHHLWLTRQYQHSTDLLHQTSPTWDSSSRHAISAAHMCMPATTSSSTSLPPELRPCIDITMHWHPRIKPASGHRLHRHA